MNDEDARLTPREVEELIGAVMRRTSGGACPRAEELLADWPRWSAAPPEQEQGSGTMAAGDEAALLRSHLEHCVPCAALARNLALVRETLPSLASFDPGPSFTGAVLAATSRAGPASFTERLAAGWNAWIARPRFALEAAYVATLVILLVGGNPAATLQAASERTASVAAAGIGRAREAWPGAIARVAPSTIELPARVRALGGATAGAAARGAAAGGLGAAWNRVLGQWSVAWYWLRGVASDMAGRVSAAMTAIRNTVTGWMNTPAEPPPPAAR
jgi:hypothetical protein